MPTLVIHHINEKTGARTLTERSVTLKEGRKLKRAHKSLPHERGQRCVCVVRR